MNPVRPADAAANIDAIRFKSRDSFAYIVSMKTSSQKPSILAAHWWQSEFLPVESFTTANMDEKTMKKKKGRKKFPQKRD